MHKLLTLVGRGFGVAIVPDPIYWPSGCVVFKRIEDFDLPAAFQLTWLRGNRSKILQDFVAITRQVATQARSGNRSTARQESGRSITKGATPALEKIVARGG